METKARFTDQDVALVMEIRDALPEILRYVKSATIELDSMENPCDTITVGDYAIVAIESKAPSIGGPKTVVRYEVYVMANSYSSSRWEPDDADYRLIETGIRSIGDAVKTICLSEIGSLVEGVIDSVHLRREEDEIKDIARNDAIRLVLAMLGPDAQKPDAEAVFDYLSSVGDAKFDAIEQEYRFTAPINFADAYSHIINLAQEAQS